MFKQAFEPRNRRFNFGKLSPVNICQILRSMKLYEIQAREKFKANRTRCPSNPKFQPFEKSSVSLLCNMQHLTSRQLFLFDHLSGNIAVGFQSIQDRICLALTQMPDLPQLNSKTLMQVVAVTWSGDQKSKQCKFW